MKWWRGLQPSWWDQGENILSHNMPTKENWSFLKKGGKAGIYTIVIGLSSWIKAEGMEHDVESWIIVKDLTWVLHQMYKTGSGNPVIGKHPHYDEDKDEGNPRPLKGKQLFHIAYSYGDAQSQPQSQDASHVLHTVT